MTAGTTAVTTVVTIEGPQAPDGETTPVAMTREAVGDVAGAQSAEAVALNAEEATEVAVVASEPHRHLRT